MAYVRKYRNKKTLLDGVLFDSKRESERYRELKLLKMAGEIHSLELQPQYKILDGFRYGGKKYRDTYYIADFRYIDDRGRVIVEDVKSNATKKIPLYRLKIKLFLSQNPSIIFREI